MAELSMEKMVKDGLRHSHSGTMWNGTPHIAIMERSIFTRLPEKWAPLMISK